MNTKSKACRQICPKKSRKERVVCRNLMPCFAYTNLEAEMMRERTNSKLLGKEEGDKCNFNGCGGLLKFTEPENCTCFRSAPCPACMDTKLKCPECGRVIDQLTLT